MNRLPAEWEPQSGVLLTWPHAATDWSDQLAAVEALYAELTALIARYEPVLIVCRDPDHAERVRALTDAAGAPAERVRRYQAPSDDTWTRDHGPLGVIDAAGRPRLMDFRFNGWGGKYPAALDDAISRTLADAGAFGAAPLDSSTLTAEGGAIETDGQGTLLAVSRTLVDPRRNPGWPRAAIEDELKRRLGLRRFLWLEQGGLSGDDTDGHIDTLARFCAPDTICYVQGTDPDDPDTPGLQAMERELRALRTSSGQLYRLAPLPLPAPMRDAAGARLPATYANFLIINGAVLVPVYGDPADRRALAILADCFPGRAIEALDCRPLIRQGGSLHCISMQLPEGVALQAHHPAESSARLGASPQEPPGSGIAST